MKNKKTYYFLLPLVIGIWSLIIYKIFSAVHQEDINPPEITQIALSDVTRPKITSRNIELSEVNRDPFLNKVYINRNAPEPKERLQKIEWPVVNYQGLISTSTKENMVAVFKINNQEVLLGKGDEFKGLKVLSASKNSAKILYKYEQRSFSK
jgi:hypothetical protein